VKALFDTCILVDYLNGRDEARTEIEGQPDRLISIITWMEVLAGARSEAEADVIEMFLRDFRLIDLSRRIAREAVALRQAHRLRLPDAVIWATARTESADLVTRNTKDFPRQAPGVRVPYA
jgi:predicted nucleic acid-binding protein